MSSSRMLPAIETMRKRNNEFAPSNHDTAGPGFGDQFMAIGPCWPAGSEREQARHFPEPSLLLKLASDS